VTVGQQGGPDTPIGLVTITYSPGDQLSALLDSIPAATGRPVTVVLADNGSTDGSVEAAAARPGVQVVRTGGNIGYGGAANAGVAALGEHFTAGMGVGFVLVLLGSALATRRRLDAAKSVEPQYS